MRRRIGVVAILLLLAVAATYLSATLLTPIAPSTAVVASFTAPAETKLALTFPNYGATAVEATGFTGSLQVSGDTKPRSIASISKIVTALVVLDKKPLNGGSGPKITFTAADHALYATYLAKNGEVATMNTGQSLTERQVLQVALIKSANNYAGALATWAFGSNAAYVQATKAWLAAHGLDHTTLVEPTGLNPANKATAVDLVSLGGLALANKDVATIVATRSVDIPGVGTVENSNKLLGIDDVVGIKTGTLDQAGACLLFATRQIVDGHRVTVVGAMLGGKDHPALDHDVQRLLAGVTAGFHTVEAVAKGDVYGTYATKWGATAHAKATRSVSALVYGDVRVTATPALRRVASAEAGATVGALQLDVGSEKISVPLALDHALTAPGAWWRITNPSSVF